MTHPAPDGVFMPRGGPSFASVCVGHASLCPTYPTTRMKTFEVTAMRFTLEIEREEGGRLLAEIPELAGVMKHGDTREEALALRVLAERIAHGEHPLEPIHMTYAAA
jgi:hypothetical protein